MISSLFNTIFYQPLYNALIFLISVIPGGDVGVAVVLLTLIVKVAILPVTHRSVKSQVKLKSIEPKVKELREQHRDDKELQAKKIMELYKEHGVSPFSGCFLVILQAPIIIALYWVFLKGLTHPNNDLLYPFITPQIPSMLFLGFIDLTKKNIVLALGAGILQYFQMKLTIPASSKESDKKTNKKGEESVKTSFQEELGKSMSTQMRYFLPVFITFIAYSISAAVALYWVVSSAFTVMHELLVRKKSEQLIKK